MKLFEITSVETENRLDTKPYKWNIKGYYKGFDVKFVSEIKKITKETAIMKSTTKILLFKFIKVYIYMIIKILIK